MDKKLGRGLSSLIGYSKKDEIIMINVDRIKPSDFQPRRSFNEKSLKELAESIRSKGVIEPIVVRVGKNGYYELVCGERRLRACKMIGLEKIPAIVKNISDQEAFEISLIENIQRENLTPIESALAFEKLTELGYSHDDIAKKIGKSRSWVTNVMRILKLPDDVKKLIDERKISLGHAKILCSIEDQKFLRELVEKIIKDSISVRELEDTVKRKISPDILTTKEKITSKLLKIFPDSEIKIKLRRDQRIEVRITLDKNAIQ
ncbi:MAG: ParB/RepB/Spo0J family partition protein [Candidatus Calescibacterium sp.]|nr:ParB/RepB/Spo0J family partition protein [Candidatus Calescibacterium sp.]MCX7734846.1 ParB/RepB/Spo0J family partition protein [bacterium]MDW8087723.1 ParB/RepB/Spo0J family partition protein [Candidatus Calescibacterium sp.]